MNDTNNNINKNKDGKINFDEYKNNIKDEEGKNADEKLALLDKLSEQCYDMENIISGDEFKDMDVETLKDIVFVGDGEKRRCYLLDTMYDYISSMIKQNKKDKITDPIDGTKIDDIQIDSIIKRYENKQKEMGKVVEKIESDSVKIEGTEMGNPEEVLSLKYNKPFVRIVINRNKNGVKMTPFVIGYLPQQYLTKDADLEVYAIIGTIGDIFAQSKLFTKGSTIDNIGIKKAFDIMRITPEEAQFLNEFYQKTSKLDLKKPADKNTYNKLLAREEDIILNNLLKNGGK